MSVMAETHQSAMGPYFAMAEAAFELNSVTAVFREALLGKASTMQAGEGEGGSGEGGEGDGGGGEGDGGGGEGDGGGGLGDDDGELASQQVFLHFLRCLAFVHVLTLLHFFLFAVSVRPLQSFCREADGGPRRARDPLPGPSPGLGRGLCSGAAGPLVRPRPDLLPEPSPRLGSPVPLLGQGSP